ncbi:related to HDA1-histone deacetylase A [Ustilago bromivora]|uniref:histone deacetylase n=1 Tax=Ustilago bromivora TaxID=307758 RepID=A0A1K0GS32_9BASI|nr:related to HDA1-histone deacetylase A [Ustilago bromivora]SYW79831.1 related to HDA1 - histone deacetylase A [Ustilago bromivora]
MAEPSRRTPVASRADPIVLLDDDDDVDMVAAAPQASTHAHMLSPSGSLTNLTPAVSVSTSSNGSDHHSNGAPVNGRGISKDFSSLDQYRSGLVYSSDMMLHSNPIDRDHPEKPVRIWMILRKLQEKGIIKHMKRIEIRQIKEKEVLLVHDKGIWKGVENSALYHPDILKEHVPMLENTSSLYINEHSAYAARLSCGGAVELCDAIASGRIRNGFAVIRPPGHHAEPHKSMGFCFYNNVAVATRCLLQKYPNTIRKVLILDWDVHHGNGTQRAFESDAEVLYISLHRYDEDGSFYPGSSYGNYTSAGTGPGEGKSVNVPWPSKGMGDADYMYAFHHLVMPIAQEFAPDFVIISAGFDAAEGDPIGQNRVSPGGYAQMTHALTSLCQGKVAVVLEGGYNPEVVAESSLAVTEVLLARKTQEPQETVACTLAAQTVQQVCRFHSKYWKSLKVPDIDTDDLDRTSASAPQTVKVTELLAEYRNKVVCEKFDLFGVPLFNTPHVNFDGQVLCSEGILHRYETIIFFIHDMGNLRSERPELNNSLGLEALQLADASSLLIGYAKSRNYGLVDMNIFKEFSATKPMLPGLSKAVAGSTADIHRVSEARSAAVFVWDNVVALAGTSKGVKNIVMVGFGSGCHVVTSLLEQRDTKHVRAVVNVVGYGEMPSLSLHADLARKKFYYNKSKVLAPADHRYILERGEAAPLKRFGKIQPINHTRAINILSSNVDEIKSFIDKKLRIARAAADTTS